MTPTYFYATSYRLSDINILNCWPRKSRERSPRAIFSTMPFDSKCENLANVSNTILPFQRYKIFLVLDLHKGGQGHGVQFSHLHYSIANVKIYKCLPSNFCASSYRFRDKNSLNCWPPKRKPRSRIAIFYITPFDGKCQKPTNVPDPFLC